MENTKKFEVYFGLYEKQPSLIEKTDTFDEAVSVVLSTYKVSKHSESSQFEIRDNTTGTITHFKSDEKGISIYPEVKER